MKRILQPSSRIKTFGDAAFVAIFHKYDGLKNSQGEVFPVVTSKGLRRVQFGNLLFIEQNPNTVSSYAARARRGERIMWVIHRTHGYITVYEEGIRRTLKTIGEAE